MRVLAEKFRGLKPPRFPTIFEALVNAYRLPTIVAGGWPHATQSARDNLRPGVDRLARCPTPFPAACRHVARCRPKRSEGSDSAARKVGALLASSVRSRSRNWISSCSCDENDEVIGQRLRELRGVGRWTAEYVLLRGFGRLHVFPGDDVGAQKRFARWLGRSRPLDYVGVRRAVARWQPYAGLGVLPSAARWVIGGRRLGIRRHT